MKARWTHMGLGSEPLSEGKVRYGTDGKYCAERILFLHAVVTLYSANANWLQRERARIALGGTVRKIEYVTFSLPTPLPSTYKSQKKCRQN